MVQRVLKEILANQVPQGQLANMVPRALKAPEVSLECLVTLAPLEKTVHPVRRVKGVPRARQEIRERWVLLVL